MPNHVTNELKICTFESKRKEFKMNKEILFKVLEMMLECDNKNGSLTDHLIGEWVIVRTYSSGVHFGKLAAREGGELILHDTRRLYRWTGAFTLSEVALGGVETAKMPQAIPEIFLPSHIEIIKCSDKSASQLKKIEPHDIN